jgi:hypothetical protein
MCRFHTRVSKMICYAELHWLQEPVTCGWDKVHDWYLKKNGRAEGAVAMLF